MPELQKPTASPTPAPAAPAARKYRAKGEKRESFQEAIDRRFAEIEATKAAAKAEALRNPPAPAEPTPTPAPAAPTPAPAAPEPTPAAPTATDLPKPPTATAPAAPAEETDAEIEAEIAGKTKDMPAEAKAAFSKLRYEMRDINRKLKSTEPQAAKAAELETQLTETKSALEALQAKGVADPEEVARLKTELEAAQKRDIEREQELAAVKVESTDAFNKAITVPTKKIEDFVKTLATKYELSEASLIASLKDTSANQSDKLLEASEKMNDIEKARFYQAAVDLQKLGEDADVMRAQAKDALALINAKSTQEAEAKAKASRQVFEAAHSTNWDKMKTLLPDVLTPVTGTDEISVAWNKAQVDAEKFAKSTDYNALPVETRSELLQRAAVFPLIAGALKSLEDQLAAEKTAHNADLQKLEGFLKAAPGSSPRTPAEPGSPAPGTKEPTDFVARINKRMAEAGF